MGLDHHMFGPTLSDIWELYMDGTWDCECHLNISEWDWKNPSTWDFPEDQRMTRE